MKELTRHLYKARSDSCASGNVFVLDVSRGPKFFRRRRVDDVVRLRYAKVVEAGDTPKEGDEEPGRMAGFKRRERSTEAGREGGSSVGERVNVSV